MCGMNYTPTQYASALYIALAHAKTKDAHAALLLRFLRLLARHKATAHLPRIMRALTRVERTEKGLTDIVVESASVLSKEIEREILHALPGKIRLKTVIHSELLAGLAITLNDELLIDATGKRQIERLMANPVRGRGHEQ